MRRLLRCLVTVITSLLLLIGCNDKNIDTIKEKTLSVKILSDKSSFYQQDKGIIFTPILEGKSDEELQYHWSLIDNQDFEGFYLPEQNPQQEIINSGEDVELGIFAMVNYIEGAYNEFKIRVEIEGKSSGNVLAEDEVVVENHAGVYKLQEYTKVSDNSAMPVLKNTEKIIATVYDQLTEVEKSTIKDNGKDAQVYKVTLREELGRINDESYIGKEVYLIDFPGEGISIPNNKIVFASMEEYKIVGYGLVD